MSRRFARSLGVISTAAFLTGAQTAPAFAGRNAQAATPTPLQYTVLSVAVHKKPLVRDPRKASFQTVRANRTIYFYIYYFVQSAPSDARVTTIFSITRGHTLFAYHRYVHRLLAPPPSGATERVGLKLQTPGRYSFSGYVLMSGHVETAGVVFRVRR